MVPKMDQAYLLKTNRVAHSMMPHKKAVRKMKGRDRALIGSYIEGTVSPEQISSGGLEAAEIWRGILNEMALAAEEAGFDVKPDFSFFPRVLAFENVREMKGNPTLFETEVQHLMKTKNMKRDQAAATLVAYYDASEEMRSDRNKADREEFYSMALKKAGGNVHGFNRIVARTKAKMKEHVIGSLAYKRTAPRLTDAMYIRDPEQVMEHYIHQGWQSITYREKFGEGMEQINNALFAEFAAPDGGLTVDGERFREYIDAELYNKSLHIKWWGAPLAAKSVSKFTRYQAWSKLYLNLISPPKNFLTAWAMSNAIHGVIPTSLGVLRTLGAFATGSPYRNAHLAGAITDRTIKDVSGMDVAKMSKLEKGAVELMPFTWSEKFVRTFGYNGGLICAGNQFRKAKRGNQKAIKLLTYYLGEERLMKDLAAGKLSSASSEMMAVQASNEMAGSVRVMNLSPYLSTNEGRLTGQFRRTAFHQQVVVKDKILLPAMRGNPLPLFKLCASLGIAVPSMIALYAAVYGEKDEKEMSTPGHYARQTLEYVNMVNSLALYGDVAASIEHGTGWGEVPVVGTFAGPTVSTVLNTMTDVVKGTEEQSFEEEEVPLWLRRELPILRQFGKITEIEYLQK
jgi:hypothetical protein